MAASEAIAMRRGKRDKSPPARQIFNGKKMRRSRGFFRIQDFLFTKSLNFSYKKVQQGSKTPPTLFSKSFDFQKYFFAKLPFQYLSCFMSLFLVVKSNFRTLLSNFN